MSSTEPEQATVPTLVALGCMTVVIETLVSLIALWILRLFVGKNLVAWWRDTLADPVFRAIAYVAIRTHGDTGATLLFTAIPFCAILWIVQTAQALMTRNSLESMQTSPWLYQDVDMARDDLRRIFSDDPEQIALFQTRIAHPSARRVKRNPARGAALGCLMSLAVQFLLGPVTFLARLAMFDGMLRITGMFQASRTVMQSAGALAQRLEPLVPLKQSAFGFDLTERSVLLTLIVAAIAILTWLLITMPRAAVMWPRGVSRGCVFSFLIGLALVYVLANSLVLLLMLVMAGFNATMLAARRFLRPQWLRAGGMWARVRAPVDGSGAFQLSPGAER